MSVSPEFQELRLSIDLKNFKNQMLELSVDSLILEKSEMTISPSLWNAKPQLPALSS